MQGTVAYTIDKLAELWACLVVYKTEYEKEQVSTQLTRRMVAVMSSLHRQVAW